MPTPGFTRERDPGQAPCSRGLSRPARRQREHRDSRAEHADQPRPLRPAEVGAGRGNAGAGPTSYGEADRRPEQFSTRRCPDRRECRFNGKITPHRRVALTACLDTVKDIKEPLRGHRQRCGRRAVRVRLRRWLTGRGRCRSNPLVAAIPISMRSQAEGSLRQPGRHAAHGAGHRQVRRSSGCANAGLAFERAKERNKAKAGVADARRQRSHPADPFGPAIRMMTGIAASDALTPVANVVISNVPGPRIPLYCRADRSGSTTRCRPSVTALAST